MAPTTRLARPIHPIREALIVGFAALLAVSIAVAPALHAPANADEFVYLMGAQRFAESGSLNAVYYDVIPLLSMPFPFQDVHSPGYVILLGLAMSLLGPGYWTAVTLNAAAFTLASLLIWDSLRQLGRPRAARFAAGCFILLPTSAVFSSWVMAEVTLGTAVLFTLWIGLRFGRTVGGALACGAALGAALLIRESACFVVPALVGLLFRSKKALVAFTLGVATFMAVVNLPLWENRGPGGANLGKPLTGQALGAGAIFAVQGGDVTQAIELSLARGGRNVRAIIQGKLSSGERWILGLFSIVFIWGLLGARWLPRDQLGLATGLWLGFLALLAVLFLLFIVGAWSGYRYLLIMVPPLLLLTPEPSAGRRRLEVVVGLALATACLVANKKAFDTLDTFKRHGQSGPDEVAYVDRYIKGIPTRIMWQNGFKYGLRRYPAEVIVSVPQDVPTFKALEQSVWFDYVVLSNWQTILDDRARYERVNADDPDPLLKVFRRLR